MLVAALKEALESQIEAAHCWIRMMDAEREMLRLDAQGAPLGAYPKLLGDEYQVALGRIVIDLWIGNLDGVAKMLEFIDRFFGGRVDPALRLPGMY